MITALGVAAAVPRAALRDPVRAQGNRFRRDRRRIAARRHPLAARQRHTHDGLVAAGRWVAVREKLDEDEEFQNQPPITVALWERLLAYGAALGVAGGAVRPIPMGAESDRAPWSSYGGHGTR